MELRQLRYFVTLAEELHFGRAANREHIVQSALSQQIQRLERELGVRLLERSTHHVALTAPGAALLVEARQILAQVERAAAVARSAVGASPALRVGIIDAGYDSMPQILHEAQARYPDLVIHQIEVGVPDQYQLLIDGRLDVGIGRAALAPSGVASMLFRQDPVGVLVPTGHRFASLEGIPVATLAEEPLLLAEEMQAPEFNQFVVEIEERNRPPPLSSRPVRGAPSRLVSRAQSGEMPSATLAPPVEVAAVGRRPADAVLRAWKIRLRRSLGPWTRARGELTQVGVLALVELFGVAELDVGFLVLGLTGGDGSAAMQFGVELGAEQDRDVRDPQPD